MTCIHTGRGAADLTRFAGDVDALVHDSSDEHRLTALVADRLRALLASDVTLPPEFTQPYADHYVVYPLHIATDGSFSIVSAVWDVGQTTPVHGHETWGVVGIYSGVEHETRYVKPAAPDIPLVATVEHDWHRGQVTICCTTDDDVHRVNCGSETPCVGIHVYGADVGRLPRRWYEPDTGRQHWFISGWATPAGGPEW
ncbi:cysteine dioxygenase [Streptomyces sp. NPDC059083]|uniref:cysteine dioxygenase family protein n=1 Tax=Streptomyces sp. NPDC059083 TaxID=3346721 RepID=UPI0036BA03F2